ncbi:hypothetical protein KIP88_18875 [Bradyrhizobium sp. SRL28]|uniref:hypothetical protein n=1 Tax=Bradyrhizobium sp. SRL28 TaxID=2836178 RepID=UPI001BDE0312|nr:hypothetical protein [Bradyrhizobium sp. SRL28]MBT1512571.1 hypothetical protein [Bradyrhizobium sp. SRL28]
MAKKAKQSTERPTVGVRLPPALRESMMAVARKKKIRLAEEIRHRLSSYDQMEEDLVAAISDERAQMLIEMRSVLTDDFIDKIAERIFSHNNLDRIAAHVAEILAEKLNRAA